MAQKKTIRMMFLGDLVGEPGLALFEKWVPRLKEKHKIDAVVVNGENTGKNGKGITAEIVQRLKDAGCSVITSGNHIWANKKIYDFISQSDVLLRPANYPSVCPGKGFALVNLNDAYVGVICVQGRVFMHEDIECPFRTVDSLISMLKTKTNIIFVEFHAEATSEKHAMRHFLDGKVTGLFGTHTHVQTSDEMILPSGTAYMTDLGFAGAQHSALGIDQKIILNRFLSQMPAFFKVEKKGPMVLNGVWVEVDVETGNTLKIERINIVDNEIHNFF